jgi:hypothetical protein
LSQAILVSRVVRIAFEKRRKNPLCGGMIFLFEVSQTEIQQKRGIVRSSFQRSPVDIDCLMRAARTRVDHAEISQGAYVVWL